MNSIRHQLSAAGICIAAVSGCNDGPGPGENNTVTYQFALAAWAADTTPELTRHFSCQVFGFFNLETPVPREGTAQFSVNVQRYMEERRGTHVETTFADSSITTAVLQYSGLGEDSLSFTLGAGPYTVALGPGGVQPNPPREYAGSWTCGASVPLANDSTLVAYGFDPNRELPGTWRVSEFPPMPD